MGMKEDSEHGPRSVGPPLSTILRLVSPAAVLTAPEFQSVLRGATLLCLNWCINTYYILSFRKHVRL
jgi:hypothetical protein